jgi:hypothetical protein
MTHLTIKIGHAEMADSCGLCGKEFRPPTGLHLVLGDSREEPVCRECGKEHAPALVALLDLARVAERVGRIGRHTLVPPLHALLDLARAAEDYTESAPVRRRQAA